MYTLVDTTVVWIVVLHNIGNKNLLGDLVGKSQQRSGLQTLGLVPPLLHTPRRDGLPLFGSHWLSLVHSGGQVGWGVGALHVPGSWISGQSPLDSHGIDISTSHKPQIWATCGAFVGDFDGVSDGDDVGSDVDILGPFVFIKCGYIRRCAHDVSIIFM